MPWRVALLAPLVVAVAAVVCFLPFLTRDREVVEATPQAPALFTASPIVVLLGPNWRVCTAPVPVTKDTDVARLRAGRYKGYAAAQFEVTVDGPGYHAGRAFADYPDNGVLDVPLQDPRQPLDAKLCVENLGPVAGLLAGSGEGRTWGRLHTTDGGKPSNVRLVLSLLQDRPASVAGRLGIVLRHAAAVQPAPAPVLAILAVLAALGLPAGVALALRRAQA
jgi:hypothetical protein